MYLRSIEVENYRAISRGTVTFDRTTVLYGENDSGRTSILEALLLILGPPGCGIEDRLRAFHFHREPDGATGVLHIRLRLVEESPGDWHMPERMRRAFPASPGTRREFVFDFRAQLDSAGEGIAIDHNIASPQRAGYLFEGDQETRNWIRDLSPVLWLQPGGLMNISQPEPDDRGGVGRRDPAFQSLAEHRRRLLAGDAPDLGAELEAGARAAHALLESHGSVFASAGSLMSAMASDILDRDVEAGPEQRVRVPTATHKLAELLLLGAMLQIAHRTLPAHAKPILVIETPEANLHPMTLSSVWRIVERIVWQKVITTNSGTILSSAPLSTLRRLTRDQGVVTEWAVRPKALSKEAVRRISYHLRSRRASAMFARCWVLVEGETEYWILPELARICGYDFATEGVACVEFAQCGLAPLIRLSDQLGIACHVLADGDAAGQHYAEAAAAVKCVRIPGRRPTTVLRERDIENCFWHNGFADVIRKIAYPGGGAMAAGPSPAIKKAIERTSKPFLALSLIDAAAHRGAKSIPGVLRGVIEAAIRQARTGGSHGIQ